MDDAVGAVVTMSPTEEEGLTSSLSLPCRSLLLSFSDNSQAQLVGVVILGSGHLEPGVVRTVQLAPIYPESVPLLKAGRSFDLWYGRTVGRGTIAS